MARGAAQVGFPQKGGLERERERDDDDDEGEEGT